MIETDEIYKALKNLNNNKSPGSDGLSKEFYMTFWNDLKEHLTELYLNIFLQRQMTPTQRTAIVKLIYKKNDPHDLRNWRPISLLNIDYKILSSALANRIKPLMEKIINEDQTCGVPGTSIQNNNDILNYIWNITNDPAGNKKGLSYLCIDQEKAFDRIEPNYIMKVLKTLNFGKGFNTWIEILYKEITSQVMINGVLTKPINIQRSVRQGCPISMLLFVIGAEGLAEQIRNNKHIEGYELPNGQKKETLSICR